MADMLAMVIMDMMTEITTAMAATVMEVGMEVAEMAAVAIKRHQQANEQDTVSSRGSNQRLLPFLLPVGIEGLAVLQDTVADHQQLSHSRP